MAIFAKQHALSIILTLASVLMLCGAIASIELLAIGMLLAVLSLAAIPRRRRNGWLIPLSVTSFAIGCIGLVVAITIPAIWEKWNGWGGYGTMYASFLAMLVSAVALVVYCVARCRPAP